MSDYGIKIGGGYDWSWGSLAVVISDLRIPDGEMVAKPLVFEKHAVGMLVEPTMRLQEAEAQQLFNLLWKEGFRPKDGTGNAGHTQALSNHLEDMRRLAFKDMPK